MSDLWAQWNPFLDPSMSNDGQLSFMILVYGYALFQASELISEACDLLLLTSWSGVVGSVVLPVLGAVPDGMMVLFSGLGPDKQNQVSVGMGALAGSTIMLLTLPWFAAMLAGRVWMTDEGELSYHKPPGIEDGVEYKNPEEPNVPFFERYIHPMNTGVGFKDEIRSSAKFMLATSVSYFIIQLPAFWVVEVEGIAGPNIEASREQPYAGIGFLVCIASFIYYLYSMFQDGCGGEKSVEMRVTALQKGDISLRAVLADFRTCSWARKSAVELNEALLAKDKAFLREMREVCKVLGPFFTKYDENQNGEIDFEEFRLILHDLGETVSKEDQQQMFDHADVDNSKSICFNEFVACLMGFVAEKEMEDLRTPRRRTTKTLRAAIPDHLEEDEEGDEGKDDEEEDMPEDLADLEPSEQQRRIWLRAVYYMTMGAAVVLLFSDPTVNVMAELGNRLNISPFYVSFVLAPIASNATELVAAYNSAKKRTKKSMTTSLSCLLGAGVMNNTFCLGIFLGLVYFNDIAWEFTAETVSILVIELIVGLVVLGRKDLRMAHGFFILTLYPLSLALVWSLENVLGID